MKLSQSVLPQYFSIADSTSSWHAHPNNTFDFVDRNSNTLVVTVGDSWTWGSDLSPNNRDDQFRKQNTYGYVVAQQLNSDWLNLALCAQGNFWIASMVDELAQIIPVLEYDCIYVICTFTGALRWFNTRYDQHIDYIAWFRDTIKHIQDFDQLPAWRNQLCVDSVLKSVRLFDHVTLKIGTNFLDATGFDSVERSQLLPTPWYQLLGLVDSGPVYTDMYYETVSQAVEFINKQHHTIFKQWLLKIIEHAERRNNLLKDPLLFRNYHPMALGHQIWAKYILENFNTC
jgi:hypothetical protein